MAEKKKRPPFVLGFYKTVTQPTGEICGGVLVTSHLGRPIEFQCSLPIRPNRTQETLYGSTLLPFIKGELIAEALSDKLSARPDLLLVDDPEALSENAWNSSVVACFQDFSSSSSATNLRGNKVIFAPGHEENWKDVADRLAEHVPEAADLREPLQRVEQALREALGQAA